MINTCSILHRKRRQGDCVIEILSVDTTTKTRMLACEKGNVTYSAFMV
jgi:hypothetical protein